MKPRMLPFLLCASLLLAAVLGTAPSAAEDAAVSAPQPCEEELRAEVPALDDYHGVIARLWHQAWPARDFDTLAALLPEIESGAESVRAAELPGILRDKAPAWNAGVEEMGRIVREYASAVADKNLQATLDAGESLHAQFERLVRIIRPALPEIDAFHQSLYQLYHYQLPAYDLDGIRSTAAEMKERMTSLNQAKLPARLESRKDAFESKRKALDEAVEKLAVVTQAGTDKDAVTGAVEQVHDRYVDLEAIF